MLMGPTIKTLSIPRVRGFIIVTSLYFIIYTYIPYLQQFIPNHLLEEKRWD